MKKVLTGHDEQISINTSSSSVPNSSIAESNEMIIMDIECSSHTQYPILDDDDSRSADFISDSNQLDPGDDASLNSSQSSLQHPSLISHNSLLIGRKMSLTSQSIQNQMTSNINQSFPSIDLNNATQMSLFNPLPPLQIDIDESNHPLRIDVRLFDRYFFSR
jgi:hypothetical protein